MKLTLIGLSSLATLLLSSSVLASTQPFQVICASGNSAVAVANNLNIQLAAIPSIGEVSAPVALPVFDGNLGVCVTVLANSSSAKISK